MFGCSAACEIGGLVAGDEGGRHAESGERAFEQCPRAAVQLGGGHDVVADLAQRADDQEFRRHATGGGDCTDTAFETREAFLERGDGRIADAAVHVAELLQGEEIGSIGGVFEHETGGLEDRDGACPGDRFGMGTGVDRPGAKRPLCSRPSSV